MARDFRKIIAHIFIAFSSHIYHIIISACPRLKHLSYIMRCFILLALFLAAISSASADNTLRRLRRTAEAIEEAVHEKYLDLANLVTNGRTLRRVAERQNLRQREMIGLGDNFSVMSDRSTLYDLYGLGIESAPAEDVRAEELSLSMRGMSFSL
jgi:hypothetical protein